METQIYRNFLDAIRLVKDPAANEILREAAAVRLGIKQKLEAAALQGGLGEQELKGAVPIMNLADSIRCCDLHSIGSDADTHKALDYAIRMAKDALEFYRSMADQCSGAPMAEPSKLSVMNRPATCRNSKIPMKSIFSPKADYLKSGGVYPWTS